MKQARLVVFSAMLIIVEGISAISCSSAQNHAQVHPPQPTGQKSLSAVTAPTSWHKVDALKEEKKPAYVVIHKPIGGRRAKIVSPRTQGHGITGVYFRNAGDSAALTLFGHDLTSTQQELVLKIFETLRFGGPVPRYVLPPPPPSLKNLP